MSNIIENESWQTFVTMSHVTNINESCLNSFRNNVIYLYVTHVTAMQGGEDA